MALIHQPDATLSTYLAPILALSGHALKCVLIDIATYDRAVDSVLADLTQVSGTGYTAGGQTVTSCTASYSNVTHKLTVVITPSEWGPTTTISATGAAIIDVTDSNRIVAVDDFQGAQASSGGTYTVGAITLEYTGF